MTTRYLSIRDIAEQTGINIDTIKSLALRGKFPDPDVIVGLGEGRQIARGWKQTTVDTWLHGYAPRARQSPGEND